MKPTPHQVNNVRSNVNRSRKKKKRINDESIMNIAMASTANDLVHVSELLNSGTKEIQDVLKHECALIYECKVCRGLFRSIINFVIHKRKYCMTKFSALNHENLSSKLQQVESLFKTTLSSSNNAESGQGKPMRTIQPPTLSSFYQSLISKTLGSVSPDGKGLPSDILKMQSATVVLDKLENTFLTKSGCNTTDNPNSELTSLINDSSTAVLREDGTIATNIQSLGQLYQNNFNSCSTTSATNSAPQPNGLSQQTASRLSCSLCKFTCDIRSSLHHHLQSKHFTWYKCDECLKSYNSLRTVLRHLNEVHHITRARVEQKYRKKVIASKVVKSVPKHLYCPPPVPSSTPAPPTTSISPASPIPRLSSCTKCSSLFSSLSLSSSLCPSCTNGSSDTCSVKSDELPSRKAHASFLLQGCSNRVVSSPASSCAGDIPSPGSPAVRLSCEENKTKAGIQVRMNYDKCSPGNPIVSKIVSEQENQISSPTLTVSPSSDSKENTQQNGENGTKDKRKNLDSITQKLLNNKMADETTCTEIKLSCSPLFNRNRGTNRHRRSVRKIGLDIVNGPIIQLDPKPEINPELKQDTNKTSDNVPVAAEEETLATPGEPKKRTRQRSLEKSVTMEITRRSLRDTSSSSNKSGDLKLESLKQDNSLDVKLNGVNHNEETEHSTDRKRKLRARSDVANKKSKSNEDLSNDVSKKSIDAQVLDNKKSSDVQVFDSKKSNDVQVLDSKKSNDVQVLDIIDKSGKLLHGSCESLEDMSSCSENERLLKCIMKEAMDITSNTCKVCTISFPNRKLLRIHVASRHVGYYRFRCAVESCNKMYFSQSDASQHARTSHTNQKEDVIRVDASTLSMSSALEVQGVLNDKKDAVVT